MGNIQKIVLFESGSRLKGLKEYLGRELETPIERGELSEKIVVETQGKDDHGIDLNRYHAAIGAVLSEGRWINLLSEEVAEREKDLAQRMSFMAVFTITAVAIITCLLYLWNENNELHARLQGRQAELNGVMQRFDQMQEGQPVIEEVFGNPHWDQVFKELSNLMPAKMTLIELSMKDNMILLKGQIEKPADQKPEELLSGFMITLEQKMFKNVHLIESRVNAVNNEVTQFEIQSALD